MRCLFNVVRMIVLVLGLNGCMAIIISCSVNSELLIILLYPTICTVHLINVAVHHPSSQILSSSVPIVSLFHSSITSFSLSFSLSLSLSLSHSLSHSLSPPPPPSLSILPPPHPIRVHPKVRNRGRITRQRG